MKSKLMRHLIMISSLMLAIALNALPGMAQPQNQTKSPTETEATKTKLQQFQEIFDSH